MKWAAFRVEYREYYWDGEKPLYTDEKGEWREYRTADSSHEAARLMGRIAEKCADIGAQCEARIIPVPQH